MTELDYQNKYVNVDRPTLIAKLKSALSEKRFGHCLRVEQTAIELADRFGEDRERAGLAGLLHDYAKEASEEELLSYQGHVDYNPDWIHWGNQVWHGPLAAMKAQRTLGLTDDEIYWAIFYHTVGSNNWTSTAKIVAIADFTEPSRSFEEAKKTRELAEQSLDAAITYKLKYEITHLVKREAAIYPQTVASYNRWVEIHREEA